MYYNRALRAAGFDPANVQNATKADEFTLHIGPGELRGSVIGNPMKCSGARACRKQRGATFAWIGAVMGILGFADGRILRYIHNGRFARGQDEGMFPVGEYKFRRTDGSRDPRRRRERRQSLSLNKVGRGIREGVTFHRATSLAAEMRRGWEVAA